MAAETILEQLMRLPPPSAKAAREYCRIAEAAASRVSLLLGARGDLDRLIGPGNHEVMLANHLNHARFVCALLNSFDPGVLTGTLEWVAKSYLSHGFSAGYWAVQIDAWLEVLRDELPEQAFAEIEPLYEFMREAMEKIAMATEWRGR
ncbi:MAG: hypothetical protein ACOZEN_11185 [Thermodesulfobacteriota bacterium]